jgi:hypothetical protein
MSAFKVHSFLIQLIPTRQLCLRQLVAGLSLWRPRFMPESVHMGFVVDTVALGQVSEFFSFLLSATFHHCSVLIYHLGGEQVGPLEATVQRHSLTPLI